jgi:RNA polymerase sigma-70 factor (ECF subfamily)
MTVQDGGQHLDRVGTERLPAATAVDEDIWRPLLEGRPESVTLLYERYGTLAHTLARRVLRDPQAAEDAVQDAFLSVWRKASTYSSARGSLRSWLCTIVRNRAIDGTRGRAGRPRLEIPLELVVEPSQDPDVCDQAITNLDADWVRACLSALSPVERQTLELAYYDGYSQSEIARLMDVPLGTVKGRTRAGLGKLRTALAGAR